VLEPFRSVLEPFRSVLEPFRSVLEPFRSMPDKSPRNVEFEGARRGSSRRVHKWETLMRRPAVGCAG
jgi:hypothetical protein